MRPPTALFAGMLGLASPALAVDQGNPEAGRALAQEHCARCHNIEPGGAFKQDPPSFTAIAVYRDAAHIRANILYPHDGMPELARVFGLNVSDLVAYITSLEETAP